MTQHIRTSLLNIDHINMAVARPATASFDRRSHRLLRSGEYSFDTTITFVAHPAFEVQWLRRVFDKHTEPDALNAAADNDMAGYAGHHTPLVRAGSGLQCRATIPAQLQPPARMTESTTDESSSRRPPIFLIALGLGGLVFLGDFLDDNFTPSGLYRQGLGLKNENKCGEAIQKFDAAIQRDRKMVSAYFNRGICHYRLGHNAPARDDFGQAIQLRPDFVEAHYNLGLAHLNLGNTDPALAAFENAIRLKPDQPDAHRLRGDILRDRGDLAEALAEYTTLVELWGGIANAQRRALLLRDMGEFDQAIAAYDRMIGSADENSFPSNERAATLREKGEIDAALATLNASILRAPGFAGAYLQRGLLQLTIPGHAAAAAQDLAKAFEIGHDYRGRMLLIDLGISKLGGPPVTDGPSIAPNMPYTPAAHYLVVRLHVARQIAGEDDAAEFVANFEKLASASRTGLFAPDRFTFWPGPIIDLFRGKATPDQVRASARDSKGVALRRHRDCETDFYLAEYHLGKGRKDEAMALLASAAAQCPVTAPERDVAKAELKRLGS